MKLEIISYLCITYSRISVKICWTLANETDLISSKPPFVSFHLKNSVIGHNLAPVNSFDSIWNTDVYDVILF